MPAPYARKESDPQDYEMPATLFEQMFFEEGGFTERTLSGDLAISSETDLAFIEEIDPGGAARNVDLDFDAEGKVVFIRNAADAAEDLTIRDSDDSSLVTISQNEAGIVYSDGSKWGGFVFSTSSSIL